MSFHPTLRDGHLSGTVAELHERIKGDPSNARHRLSLFELLSVTGEWDRALTQLNVAGELDPGALAVVQMYREALRCEVLRREVFAGQRSPVVFGEPEPWIALLIEALRLSAREQTEKSDELRGAAFEAAAATPGTLIVRAPDREHGAAAEEPTPRAFEWIADADSRLGPVLEAIVNGRYYWIPFSRLSRIDIEEPADLRDVVWMPAHFEFTNGGEAVGLIPSRYPGSETSTDGAICLARKTVWEEMSPGVFHGFGQRVLTTEAGEHPLMDVRKIVLSGAPAAQSASARTDA
jgi:type VI secretion system protein ImpE